MTSPDNAPFHAVAFGPHPDDVELFCGGTVARLVRLGYRTAIVDLSEGELSSRGNVDTRRDEARAAAEVLGVQRRTNLGLPDGSLENNPDNRRAVRAAAFQAGLARVDTGQPPHRTDGLLHYMCHHPFAPSLVVDVSEDQQTKVRAIACYRTQFATEILEGADAAPGPDTGEPETPISTPRFMEQLLARSTYFGSLAGVRHGEPFLTRLPPLVDDPMGLFPGQRDSEEEGR